MRRTNEPEAERSTEQTVNVAALQAVFSMVRDFSSGASGGSQELPRRWRVMVVAALISSGLSLLGVAFLCWCVVFGSPGRAGDVERRTLEGADEVHAMYRRVQPLYIERFGGPYPAHEGALREKLSPPK